MNNNRYAGNPRYHIDANQFRKTPEDVLAERAAQKKQQQSEMWGNVARVGLPIAGGLLGAGVGTLLAPGIGTAAGGTIGAGLAGGATMAGMSAGMGLGNAAGNAVGQGMSNEGERALDPMREKEMRRQAMLQALMMLRR